MDRFSRPADESESEPDRFADPFDATPSRPSQDAGDPVVEEDTKNKLQKIEKAVEDKMESYRETFERTWNKQVLPVIKEVARTGVTETVKVGKNSIKITFEVAKFFITHPIVHLGIFCGAAVAGTYHVSSYNTALATRAMLESAIKIFPSRWRPELEEVDNEFDKWKMAMTMVNGGIAGGAFSAMTALGFQLLNKAIYGVGLYAKADQRIPTGNMFESAIKAGSSAALALGNAATVGAVGAIGDMVRGSDSRGQLALPGYPAQLALPGYPAQLPLQGHHAQIALQYWTPGVQAMFPRTQIVAYPHLALPPTQAITYPHGVNALALPSSSSNAAPSSYDFNEYPTMSQEEAARPPWMRGQGRGYGGPTEADNIKGISAFSKMTPAQQAMQTKPQLVVSRAVKARTKGGAKTIKGLAPVLEFNEAADDPYLMRQQAH
jgi:hypothetical protein